LIKDAIDAYVLAIIRACTPPIAWSNVSRGLDFEVFSFALLEEAYRHASSLAEKEHVTPYLYQNNLKVFLSGTSPTEMTTVNFELPWIRLKIIT
jgi:spore coat polysaccharide biosynthesis protein SpsF (cytidylyltransferase family)